MRRASPAAQTCHRPQETHEAAKASQTMRAGALPHPARRLGALRTTFLLFQPPGCDTQQQHFPGPPEVLQQEFVVLFCEELEYKLSVNRNIQKGKKGTK